MSYSTGQDPQTGDIVSLDSNIPTTLPVVRGSEGRVIALVDSNIITVMFGKVGADFGPYHFSLVRRDPHFKPPTLTLVA